jgi:secreted trypsin-like serine protease
MCAQSKISQLGEYEMQIGQEDMPRKCHGDSGGPSLMQVKTPHENNVRVVGITSHGYSVERGCQDGGVDTRVDVWLDWIDAQMREACEQGFRRWCQIPGIISPELENTY